jgi:hypothetical protein
MEEAVALKIAAMKVAQQKIAAMKVAAMKVTAMKTLRQVPAQVLQITLRLLRIECTI